MQQRKIPFNPRMIACAVGCLIIVLILLSAVYFYQKYQRAQYLLSNEGVVNQMKLNDIMQRVGNLMVLPQDEMPTIATVSDMTKLQNEPFFSSARNGDIVLIYARAKKAILYDPVLNKIINIGPISIPQNLPTPTITPSQKNGIILQQYPSPTAKPSGP